MCLQKTSQLQIVYVQKKLLNSFWNKNKQTEFCLALVPWWTKEPFKIIQLNIYFTCIVALLTQIRKK